MQIRRKGPRMPRNYVDEALDKAEKGKLGGTLRGSRFEGVPVPRPSSVLMPPVTPPPPPKSHKPSGVSLSPKGDLGDHSAREVRAAFPRNFKRMGDGTDGTPSSRMPYRRPSVMNDYGDKGATL